MSAGHAWWQSPAEDATDTDRYETPVRAPRPWPIRALGDPTDDASLPIPYYGGAA